MNREGSEGKEEKGGGIIIMEVKRGAYDITVCSYLHLKLRSSQLHMCRG